MSIDSNLFLSKLNIFNVVKLMAIKKARQIINPPTSFLLFLDPGSEMKKMRIHDWNPGCLSRIRNTGTGTVLFA